MLVDPCTKGCKRLLNKYIKIVMLNEHKMNKTKCTAIALIFHVNCTYK